ncbi:MAG: pyridoxal phosphate-dependent aminotransferase [Oscillospiraceae bacterium]
MKELSNVACSVEPSATLSVDALAKKLKAEGQDIVGFGAGEPDFETPDNIKAAGIRAIEQGKTRYTPAAGMKELREACAYRLKEDFNLDYDYKQLVIANGAKHVLYTVLTVLINPGDEVIIPAPYWVSYYEMVRMVSGHPVIIRTKEAQHFKITPEQLEGAITDKTKAFMINNPSNPTGMLYTNDELQALADICVKHDIYIISDEIYYRLVYDNKEFVSIASLGPEIKKRTILVNGVSKSYAMTGWRIGYAASNPEIASVMGNLLSHSASAPSTISQVAATEALTGPQDTVEAMRKVFEERRNYIVERMNKIDGVSCISPDGAFYVMMNIKKLFGRTIGGWVINNADDFAYAFLAKGLVAVVPCTAFGTSSFVRWTYATSMENIKKGLDRLETFLKGEEF